MGDGAGGGGGGGGGGMRSGQRRLSGSKGLLPRSCASWAAWGGSDMTSAGAGTTVTACVPPVGLMLGAGAVWPDKGEVVWFVRAEGTMAGGLAGGA